MNGTSPAPNSPSRDVDTPEDTGFSVNVSNIFPKGSWSSLGVLASSGLDSHGGELGPNQWEAQSRTRLHHGLCVTLGKQLLSGLPLTPLRQELVGCWPARTLAALRSSPLRGGTSWPPRRGAEGRRGGLWPWTPSESALPQCCLLFCLLLQGLWGKDFTLGPLVM